jgi:hypothetical protein
MLLFLVFGIPLIDDLYRLRTRRAANRAVEIAHDTNISLVPEENEQNCAYDVACMNTPEEVE